MRVEVYRNLNQGTWSVRDVAGCVLFHARCVVLACPEFVVSEPGRQRVIRQGRKNVHAVARGCITHMKNAGCATQRITYNPYEHAGFVIAGSDRIITGAEVARFTPQGAFVYNPTFERVSND